MDALDNLLEEAGYKKDTKIDELPVRVYFGCREVPEDLAGLLERLLTMDKNPMAVFKYLIERNYELESRIEDLEQKLEALDARVEPL